MKELKEIRKKEKLRQIDFASKIGFSQSYISKLESGIDKPNAELLIALRKFFGFNVNKYIDSIGE